MLSCCPSLSIYCHVATARRQSAGAGQFRRCYDFPMRCSVLLLLIAVSGFGQTVLKPTRVFDGETLHEGWAVRVRGDRIEAAGPAASIDATGAKVIDLPG